MKKQVLLINGPNLNLLGTRETDIYGNQSLGFIVKNLREKFSKKNVTLLDLQSNYEGEIINFLHQHLKADFVLINPAAFSHTSLAIYDALKAIEIDTVEIHISNIYARENFRKHSYISAAAKGVISGFGIEGYFLAADYILTQLEK